jgi:hypothetical protein
MTRETARPPREPIAKYSVAIREMRSIRSRSAVQDAAMIGASVVISESGTKWACSTIR